MPRHLVEKTAKRLVERKESLSLAESCTGGLLSSFVAELPGVSQVFLGSVVAYSNTVKTALLDVPTSLLESVGAVSAPVALKMAEGVKMKIGSTWSVSITGIAGPGGGTPQKPVGTVCFAVCGPGVAETDQQLFSGARTEIQQAAAEHALKLLLKNLGESSPS